MALKNVILATQQETSLDGILVVDERGTIQSYNWRFVEMWRIPPELVEAKDDALALQFSADQMVDTKCFLERINYLKAHKEEQSREEITLKDGRIFDRYSAPMTGADGKYHGRVWYFRDITELQRTRQEMLKTEKLESLGVLAGGIAHDFNNILAAILGNISLARIQAHDQKKLAQRLEDAENATARAKDLTQQLLTFARGGDPVKKVIKVSSLLKEAAGFASHGSGVKCIFVLADNLWPVEADEGQLSQVIHNLVLNAIQAMPNGGKITVIANNAEPLSGGKKFVKISVEDTGTGIPDDLLPKIFDPYFTTKQQGSGLGLASCFSIISKHDGKIRVESVLGKGTTFHISLPAAEQREETEPATRLEVVRGKGRVLVMDDEEMVREMLIESLEELGYLAESTEDGGAAVELYRKRQEEGTPFAAVIMDLTIPGGIGGKEAISSLRQIDPNVKAIVSSGYATDPILANCREYGFSGVLSKPYSLQSLSKVLQELLNS
jgi:signal transduction histidine kinase/ActR/RegA family two-component response regulator